LHLHPEIVKKDAFFRFDTISPTRGQVEFRFRFPKIEKHRLDLGGGKASDGARKTRFEASTLSFWLRKKNSPHSKHTRITEVVEQTPQRRGCDSLLPPQELHFFLEREPRRRLHPWPGRPRRVRRTDSSKIVGESEDSVSTKSCGCRKPPHKSTGQIGQSSQLEWFISRRQAEQVDGGLPPPSMGYMNHLV